MDIIQNKWKLLNSHSKNNDSSQIFDNYEDDEIVLNSIINKNSNNNTNKLDTINNTLINYMDQNKIQLILIIF